MLFCNLQDSVPRQLSTYVKIPVDITLGTDIDCKYCSCLLECVLMWRQRPVWNLAGIDHWRTQWLCWKRCVYVAMVPLCLGSYAVVATWFQNYKDFCVGASLSVLCKRKRKAVTGRKFINTGFVWENVCKQLFVCRCSYGIMFVW